MKLRQLRNVRIRDARAENFSRLLQLRERSCSLGNRNLRVRCMEIVQFDTIGVQPLQTFLAFPANRLWPTVAHFFSRRIPMKPRFCGDDDVIPAMPENSGNHLLALTVVPVTVRGIKKIDACINSGLQSRQTVRFGDRNAGDSGNGPASHSNGRYPDFGFSDWTSFEGHGGRHP